MSSDRPASAVPSADPPPNARNNPPLRIVIAVGLPGSGKSDWFHKRGILPLSSDQLRGLLADDETEQRYQAEIFGALQNLLRVRLRLGRPVSYVDATNLVREYRRPFLDIAREFRCELEVLFFDVPFETCLARNAARDRRVPEEAMRSMLLKFDPPRLDEGFQRIVVIDEHGQSLREIRECDPRA